MPLIKEKGRIMQDGTKMIQYTDTVGPSFITYTLENEQESVLVSNKGVKPIVFSVGATTLTLNPGENKRLEINFTSFQVKSVEGIQQFEVLMDEVGTVGAIGGADPALSQKVNDLTSQLAETEQQLVNTGLKINERVSNATRKISELQSIVTFIDDDGYNGVLTKLKPMFTAKGVPCCVALTGYANVLETEQKRQEMKELQDVYGWEMMSHTNNHIHLNSSTDEEVETDTIKFLKLMNQYGLDVQSIVYPWGERGNTTLLSKYYVAGFTTTPGKNDITLDDYGIRRETLGNAPHDLQYYKDLIDSAVGKNEWIVFMTHVDDPNTNVQMIQDVLDYAVTKLPVMTAKEGLKLYGSLLLSRENSTIDERYIRIKANGVLQANRYFLNHNALSTATITGDTLPSQYELGTTTKSFTNASATPHLPIGGTLVTTKTTTNNGFTSQFLFGLTGGVTSVPIVYYRSSTANLDSWTNWINLTGIENNNITETSSISDFQYGESIKSVTGWSLGNGTVKTIRAWNVAGYGRQVFYTATNDNIYTRRESGTGWTAWKQIQLVV